MPSEDDRSARRLLDIIENIDKAVVFVTGYTYERFADDDRTIYAVVRALEIVSEASRHISQETKDRYPDIAWREIAAAGNVLSARLSRREPGHRVGHGSTSTRCASCSRCCRGAQIGTWYVPAGRIAAA
jgi:uncharacterized protein with HEPN domain